MLNLLIHPHTIHPLHHSYKNQTVKVLSHNLGGYDPHFLVSGSIDNVPACDIRSFVMHPICYWIGEKVLNLRSEYGLYANWKDNRKNISVKEVFRTDIVFIK
mgnify:CR=1 FL=1